MLNVCYRENILSTRDLDADMSDFVQVCHPEFSGNRYVVALMNTKDTKQEFHVFEFDLTILQFIKTQITGFHEFDGEKHSTFGATADAVFFLSASKILQKYDWATQKTTEHGEAKAIFSFRDKVMFVDGSDELVSFGSSAKLGFKASTDYVQPGVIPITSEGKGAFVHFIDEKPEVVAIDEAPTFECYGISQFGNLKPLFRPAFLKHFAVNCSDF